MFEKLLGYLERNTISFDLRSLGLFRIALGFALIYNLIVYRFPAVGVYYNNRQWLPEASASDYYGESFPLFNWSDSNLWYYFLLSLMLLLSILLMIGYKTKWITPVLFITFASLITTNPYLSHGVEYLEETALFWAMFLPLNRRFQLFQNQKASFLNFGKLAQLGFQFQLFLIYFSSWIFKNGELWRKGQLLEVVSNDLIHARPLLQQLGTYPELAQSFTYAGFYLEVLVSILLLLSFFFQRARYWSAISIILLHGIMALFLHVGTFFLIGLAFGVLLLPQGFWSWKIFPDRWRYQNSIGLDILSVRWKNFKRVFILVIILFILHGNLHHWSKNSYLSPFLSSLPLYKNTIGKQLADPGIFTGFWHQSWKFFPNNIYDDLGDFLFIGYDENEIPYELRTSEKLYMSSTNGSYHIEPLPTASYFGAEFTFGVYYKFYQDRFPVSTQKGWLELQLNKYKQANPEKIISKAELWKVQRFHTYDGKTLILKDTLFRLVRKNNP